MSRIYIRVFSVFFIAGICCPLSIYAANCTRICKQIQAQQHSNGVTCYNYDVDHAVNLLIRATGATEGNDRENDGAKKCTIYFGVLCDDCSSLCPNAGMNSKEALRGAMSPMCNMNKNIQVQKCVDSE